jgi:hypothetical protein
MPGEKNSTHLSEVVVEKDGHAMHLASLDLYLPGTQGLHTLPSFSKPALHLQSIELMLAIGERELIGHGTHPESPISLL